MPSVNYLNDGRIQHFYDHTKSLGRAIADSVGWFDKIAWDIYLFYQPTDKWADTPPGPKYWMHQLKDDWAAKETYRTGSDLTKTLSTSMEKLMPGHTK